MRALRSIKWTRWPVLALGLVAAGDAAARQTDSCNTRRESQLIVEVASVDAGRRILQELVGTTGLQPDTRFRFWEPTQASLRELVFSPSFLVVAYPEVEDVMQIAAGIASDGTLAAKGVTGVEVNGALCSLPPPESYATVVEFFNRLTGHYFMATDASEASGIDGGAAGPGWERTGETFRVLARPREDCNNWLRVHRFYAAQPNSHVYTVSPTECGGLRKPGTGWVREGTQFWALPPNGDGTCPGAAPTPVYRLYNNRWMHGDSNHRFTVQAQVRGAMRARGWIDEGTVMCVRTGN